MIGNKKNKEKEKKIVRDDFYDKQNYREIRNIFSSNETFDPKNIISTDPAGNSHAIWDKINDTSMSMIPRNEENIQRSVLTNNIISSITKLNSSTNYTPSGCSKCGYVGHYAFQCLNHMRLKSNETKNKKEDNNLTEAQKNEFSKLIVHKKRSRSKSKDKKSKKDKKNKKDRKSRKHRSKSESSSRSEIIRKKKNGKRRSRSRSISRDRHRDRHSK